MKTFKLLIFIFLIIYPFTVFAVTNTVTNTPCSSGEVVTGYNSDGSPICSKSFFVVGGSGGSGAFTYNGETTCTGDVCRGGTCSGTAPNGVCTLNVNSILGRYGSDNASSYGDPSPTDKFAAVYEYSSFTLQGGTVTIGGEGDFGGGLIIYVSGDVNITGGKIDLKGKGQKAGTPGAVQCNATGNTSGQTRFGHGTGGGKNAAGENGSDVDVFSGMEAVALLYSVDHHVGGAGAFGSEDSSVGAANIILSYGAPGGGGGGCDTSCSATVGTPGDGGGYLKMEVEGVYSCSGATIDVSGTDASGALSGGGGGGLAIIGAKSIGTNTCTYTVSGGSGGTSGTNCGAGGNGGNGRAIFIDLP